MASAVNLLTSSRLHNAIAARNLFANKSNDEMISLGRTAFRITCRQLGGNFKYDQVQSRVQTTRESHDLNMFRS